MATTFYTTDALGYAQKALDDALALLGEIRSGTATQTKIDQDMAQLPAVIGAAKAQIAQAATEKSQASAQIAALQNDASTVKAQLEECQKKLQGVATTQKGEPLPPGMWVSGSATAGIALFALLLGATGGAIAMHYAMKDDDDDKKKKELTNGAHAAPRVEGATP